MPRSHEIYRLSNLNKRRGNARKPSDMARVMISSAQPRIRTGGRPATDVSSPLVSADICVSDDGRGARQQQR